MGRNSKSNLRVEPLMNENESVLSSQDVSEELNDYSSVYTIEGTNDIPSAKTIFLGPESKRL